mmetsp:Transcript_36466/g.113622  ORF Transcript_36466/g.113622 Transcript_36466/m.113622 type:complete len:217 (-) Transcript_36466:2536-3186(-)
MGRGQRSSCAIIGGFSAASERSKGRKARGPAPCAPLQESACYRSPAKTTWRSSSSTRTAGSQLSSASAGSTSSASRTCPKSSEPPTTSSSPPSLRPSPPLPPPSPSPSLLPSLSPASSRARPLPSKTARASLLFRQSLSRARQAPRGSDGDVGECWEETSEPEAGGPAPRLHPQRLSATHATQQVPSERSQGQPASPGLEGAFSSPSLIGPVHHDA